MKRLFKLFTLLFLCAYLGIAQESPKKHAVSSGETLFSIAKKYNVTPYDLQQANPGAIDGIKVDEVLIIPESKIKTPILESVADSIKASVASASISYTVKRGETKYGLSKQFGLTIPELESQNPHIISGLQAGHVLEIFRSSVSSNTTPTTSFSANEKTHLVLKGETLWGISHDNGLTVNELVSANTDVISGVLKEGQTLRIPNSDQNETSNSFESYLVKRGDTKYGLSKKFNTTIPKLERENPHIVRLLMAGHTIRIPSDEAPIESTETLAQSETVDDTDVEPIKDNKTVEETETMVENEENVATNEESSVETTEKEEEELATNTLPVETIEETAVEDATTTSNKKYSSYVVKPKETLYGLAKKAGMSIPDFLALNPQLKESVQIGTTIMMPNDNTVTENTTLSDASDTANSTSRYTDLRTSVTNSQPKKLLFFLPFSQIEYQNYAVNGYNFNIVSDDFKRNHLEFYKGANIAIDSIRALQIDLDVEIVEAQNTKRNSKINALAEDNNIKVYDAIILPFYGNVEEEVSAFTAEGKIPVITASTIAHQTNTDNLFSAVPSVNQQRKKVLDYMVAKQANIIVLSDVNRAESKTFISEHVPNAEFVDIKKNGTFSEDELTAKFKKDQLNYVVLDSERNSVFLNTTNVLLSEMTNFTLQLAVLESSLIPDDNDVSQKRYRILKMIFPSLTPAKVPTHSKHFKNVYQKKYNLQPSINILLGFDITFDTLLRLAQQQSFENSAENDVTEYTKLKFNYEKNTLGGFSNEGIYILQYDTDSNIREAN